MHLYLKSNGTLFATIPEFRQEESLTMEEIIIEGANCYAKRQEQEHLGKPARRFGI